MTAIFFWIRKVLTEEKPEMIEKSAAKAGLCYNAPSISYMRT